MKNRDCEITQSVTDVLKEKPMEEVLKKIPLSLFRWISYKSNTKKLVITEGFEEFEAISELFPDAILSDKNQLASVEGKFDYIIATGLVEMTYASKEILEQVYHLLNEEGELLLVCDNPLSLSYFCGEKDRFSNGIFDSIDQYYLYGKNISNFNGRSFSHEKVKKLLREVGFQGLDCMGVLPSLSNPQILLREGYEPNETLLERVFPEYRSSDSVFAQERVIYDMLSEHHMLYAMASGYLLCCTKSKLSSGEFLDLQQVTLTGNRGEEKALATLLYKDCVKKKALYEEGNKRIEAMLEHNNYLTAHGVNMPKAWLEENAFVTEFVQGKTVWGLLRELLKTDVEGLYQALDELYAAIVQSSAHVPYEQIDWEHFVPKKKKAKKDDPNRFKWLEKTRTEEGRKSIGPILERGYVDLFAVNCFYKDQQYIFFDQEEYVENFPAKGIFIRTLDSLYACVPVWEQGVTIEELLKHYDMYEDKEDWRRFSNDFLNHLRNDDMYMTYYNRSRLDEGLMRQNRMRMKYSDSFFKSYVSGIFNDIQGKEIYLFGAGIYAKSFIEKHGAQLEIAGIIDNNSSRWGDDLEGILIQSPEILLDLSKDYKVFICMKQYEQVFRQLKNMGVKNIAVVEPAVQNYIPRNITFKKKEKSTEELQKKPYSVGYVAGVFDLFHVGHVNLFRKAKEQCEYLIVGVVTDEQVRLDKQTTPVISQEERKEIIESCKYVDEAVFIPKDRADTYDAWNMYHFDVQFSGSDYENDPEWICKKQFLNKQGADLVFFPYTQSTSTTKIKEKLSLS